MTTKKEPPKLLNTEEVAEIFRMSERQVRYAERHGTIPQGARIAGKRYWRERDVLAWLDRKFDQAQDQSKE